MGIADTGFWLALANRAERYHHVAKERLSAKGCRPTPKCFS
jgi:predicted nucleic acid-binding protein